jgi:transposase
MPSPDLVLVVLTGKERQVLAEWARPRKATQAPALRARIILACAEGASNTEVAAAMGISRATVAKWRSRFVAARLGGLNDLPRPGAPRKITDEQIDLVITKSMQELAPDGALWTTRSMAAATGLSQTAISRIWRAFDLKPEPVQNYSGSGEIMQGRRSANQVRVRSASATRVKFLISNL